MSRDHRRDLLKLFAIFLLTRAVAISATHLGAVFMTPAKHAEWVWIPDRGNLFPGPAPSRFLAPLVRWDANFYISLKRDGYPPKHDSPNHHLAFFPLYPLLLRAMPMDVFWAAFLLSNVCALIASIFVYRLSGIEAAALFLCAPGSHFLTYPYTESLFCAALAGSLLLLRSERYVAAGCAGAIASATRSAGVAAAVALAVAGVTAQGGRVRIALGIALSLSGVGAYMYWCHVNQGDSLAFVHLQAYHGRSLSPLGVFKAFAAFDSDPDYYLISIAALWAAFRLIGRTPGWQWGSALFLVFLPLSTGSLRAMVRYQSANVPLLCGVPQLVQGRRWRALLAVSLALMAFEAFLYGKGIGHN